MTRAATILAAAPAIRSRHGLGDKEKLRKFAAAVQDRREKLDITRKEFAGAVGISYSQVAHIELADHWPSLVVFEKICSVLKVGKPPLMG